MIYLLEGASACAPFSVWVLWHSTTHTLHSWLNLLNTNHRWFAMDEGRFNKSGTYIAQGSKWFKVFFHQIYKNHYGKLWQKKSYLFREMSENLLFLAQIGLKVPTKNWLLNWIAGKLCDYHSSYWSVVISYLQ